MIWYKHLIKKDLSLWRSCNNLRLFIYLTGTITPISLLLQQEWLQLKTTELLSSLIFPVQTRFLPSLIQLILKELRWLNKCTTFNKWWWKTTVLAWIPLPDHHIHQTVLLGMCEIMSLYKFWNGFIFYILIVVGEIW